MIDLSLTKPQARRLLKLLDGPSVADPNAAALYETVRRALAEAEPVAPWRRVVDAWGTGAYRGDGRATNLVLACDHRVRMTGATEHEIRRRLARGETMKRRCHECAGLPPRCPIP